MFLFLKMKNFHQEGFPMRGISLINRCEHTFQSFFFSPQSLYYHHGKLPPFDVSGVDGATGTSGESFTHFKPPLGQHGLSGGHGTEGQHGTSAGTIAVQFSTPRWIETRHSYCDGEVKSDDYVSDHVISKTANIPIDRVLANPIDVEVYLDGSIVSTDGHLQKMGRLMTINSDKSISFLALGGHGGDGGDGGDGGSGGKGFKYVDF